MRILMVTNMGFSGGGVLGKNIISVQDIQKGGSLSDAIRLEGENKIGVSRVKMKF